MALRYYVTCNTALFSAREFGCFETFSYDSPRLGRPNANLGWPNSYTKTEDESEMGPTDTVRSYLQHLAQTIYLNLFCLRCCRYVSVRKPSMVSVWWSPRAHSHSMRVVSAPCIVWFTLLSVSQLRILHKTGRGALALLCVEFNHLRLGIIAQCLLVVCNKTASKYSRKQFAKRPIINKIAYRTSCRRRRHSSSHSWTMKWRQMSDHNARTQHT